MATTAESDRLTQTEAQAQARAFLDQLIGASPDDLCWDETYHRQGHMHIGDHELVVIAPCDRQHEPVVLTAEDWDEVRHASGDEAIHLIRQRAIHDQQRLNSLVR